MRVSNWNSNYKEDFKRLNLKWLTELFKVEESDIKQLDNPEESIVNIGGEIFFLIDENKVIGTIAIIPRDHECELSKLAIDDGYKGKKLSSLLVDKCIEWAKNKQYPSIMLLCNTDLVPAINLYKKHGFVTAHLGQHPDYVRCNIVMRRILH